MKNIYYLIFILLILLSFHHLQGQNIFDEPQRTTINGKIENFDTQTKEVELRIFYLGFQDKSISTFLDNEGSFSFDFYIYTPTNGNLIYNDHFIDFIIYPNDNLYIIFDASFEDSLFLESLQFKGGKEKINQQIVNFDILKSKFKNPKASQEERIAVNTYTPVQYKGYRDSMRTKNKKILNLFIDEFSPEEETKIYLGTNIDIDYYKKLASYALIKSHQGNSIPLDYYNVILEYSSLSEQQLIASDALNSSLNSFVYVYIYNQLWEGGRKI